MPARSKAQRSLMQAVSHGWQGGPKGLSKAEAAKFLADSPKSKKLPARAPKNHPKK